MNWELPPEYENNPEEALRFYWQQLQTTIACMMDNESWKVRLLVGLAMAVVVLWRVRALLYPMSTTVILKVMAYGIIPLVLAWAGDHFAVKGEQDAGKRRMYRAFFILFAMLGVLLIALVENKSDRDHTIEVSGLSTKIDSVHTQNDTILQRLAFSAPEQDPQAKEVSRRQNILAVLRNEYVLTHKDVSSALIAGTEQPPPDWINQRLKELGQKWSVEKTSPLNPVNQSGPSTIEVAPTYGNLQARCEVLIQSLIEFIGEREEMRRKWPAQMSPQQVEQQVLVWMGATDHQFRFRGFLGKMQNMREEFATLHIRNERLDERLDRDRRTNPPIIINGMESPRIPDSPIAGFWLQDIQDMVDELRNLASQVPH